MNISCAATGLSLELKFKDKTVVVGQLLRHIGPRGHPVAHVSGSWSGQIHVRSPSKHSREPAQEGKPTLLPNSNVIQLHTIPQWCVTSIPSRLQERCRQKSKTKVCKGRRQTQHMYCIGLLFDCEECGGAVAGCINLRKAEPMQMAGLWSCIYDAMHCNQEISRTLSPIPSSKVALLTAAAMS